MKLSLILCCLLAAQFLNGQPSFPGFGEYSPEELNLNECSFEKTADAAILFDEAVSDHDENYRLITYRRIRLKILNQRGIDHGTIKIRFYSKDNF